MPELLEVVVGEHGMLHLEPLRLRGTLLEEIPARAEGGHQRHHRLLADRVDRRVGHLGEQLLEVVEQRQRPIAEHRERRVVAHRADRLLTRLAHRLEQHLDVLEAVAEGLLTNQERARVRRRHVVGRIELVHVHRARTDPLAVWLCSAERALDRRVVENPSRLGVDEQEPPGLQPPLPGDAILGQIENARLGRHDHEAVLGDEVPGGAQAVAVQRRTDDPPVGEGDRRRSVPRLEQRAVKLVEGAALVVHQRVLVPRLGNHHHHRVLDRPAGHGEQLERIVELRGVGARFVEDGHELRDVIPEVGAAELRLACTHPVHIPAKRVDLPVVRRHPERLGQIPPGQHVGGETRVHQRQHRCQPLVDQVRVEARKLRGGEHSLVDNGAARHAGPVESIATDAGCERVTFDDPSEHEQPPFERRTVEADRGDEELPQHGQRQTSGAAHRVRDHWDVTPAEQAEPLGSARPERDVLALLALSRVLRQHRHPDPV